MQRNSFTTKQTPLIRYRCEGCGAVNWKWSKTCIACGRRGTLVRPEVYGVKLTAIVSAHDDGLLRLGDIEATDVPRLSTGIEQLDDALGGEDVKGMANPCVIQLGGQPGIGKSTLLLQVANNLHEQVLYVSAEELGRFIAIRAKRLKLPNADKIRFLGTSSPNLVKEKIILSGASVVILDSLQGMKPDRLENGAVPKATQLATKEIAQDLINFALKKDGYEDREGDPVTIIMINHVNKQGDLSGLKEIEHDVDVVSWFTGLRNGKIRTFQLEKNRFGPTDKKATFMMGKNGLQEHEPETDEDGEDSEAEEAPSPRKKPTAKGKPVKKGKR